MPNMNVNGDYRPKRNGEQNMSKASVNIKNETKKHDQENDGFYPSLCLKFAAEFP
jgi:hypothetical protein